LKTHFLRGPFGVGKMLKKCDFRKKCVNFTSFSKSIAENVTSSNPYLIDNEA